MQNNDLIIYSLRIEKKDYEKIKKIAEENDRSINKQINRFLKKSIDDYEKINSKLV